MLFRWLFGCLGDPSYRKFKAAKARRAHAGGRRAGRWCYLPFIEHLETRLAPAAVQMLASDGQLPLRFEANQSQSAAYVDFLARGNGYTLLLSPGQAVLSLEQAAPPSQSGATVANLPAAASVLDMQLRGADPTAPGTGLDEQASVSNYLLGSGPSQWRTNVANYGQVEYQSVYPGINLIYYGNQSQLEYDFDVAPGANPGTIALAFQGADSMNLDADGNLVLHMAGGDVVEDAPVLYQESAGVRAAVAGHYVIEENNQVGFAVGAYDTSKPLVIDPVLSSTSTTVTSSVNPSVFGQAVSFTATVTPGSGTFDNGGTVTLSDGSTSLGTGGFLASPSWSTAVASMPTARSGLAAVEGPDGRIYAIGGFDLNGKLLNTVEAFTPGTNTWTTVLGMPTARADLAAVEGSDGRIYVIGGFDGSHLNTVEAFTPGTNTWTTVLAMPTARADLAAVEGSDGRIYAIGGQDINGNPLNIVEAYTPGTNTWTTVASLPTARFNFAAVEGPDGRIYVIGGQDINDNPLNTVEAYTPGTNTWTTVAVMPTARSNFAAVEGPDGRVYAIGGSNGVRVLNTVEAYTPGTNTWTTLASMPTARPDLAAAEGSDGRIYAIGGIDGSFDTLNTIEAFTATDVAFFTTPSLTVGTHTLTASYSGDTNFTTSSGSVLQTVNVQSLRFSDNFNRPNSPNLGANYTQPLGNLAIANNEVLAANPTANLALYTGASATDVNLQADVSLALTGFSHAGLIARYTGPGDSNMYLGALVRTQGSLLGIIYRNLGGSWTELTSAPAPVGTGTLRFEVQGDFLQMFLNGSLLASTFDNTIQGPGLVGIRAGAATIGNLAAVQVLNALPFADNFQRANSPNLGGLYTQPVGQVVIQSNEAVAATPSVNLALYNEATLADVSENIEINVGTTGVASAGLVARYTGPGDSDMYLGALVGINGLFFGIIYRNVGGIWSELSRAPAPAGVGTLLFEVQGNSLKLSLNGSLLAAVLDSAIQGPGLVGIRAGAATMNDFAAEQLQAALPFTDNFARANSPNLGNNYTQAAGTLSIQSGAVVAGSGINLALYNAASLADVSENIEVNVGTTGVASAGLVARYTGPGDSNMYLGALVGIDGLFFGIIYRNVGGIWSELSRVPAPAGMGTLLFEVQGSSAKLSLNGSLLAAVLDSAIQGPGLVGIRADAATMNDFAAEQLQSSLPFTDNFARANSPNLVNNYTQAAGAPSIQSGAVTAGSGINLALYNDADEADVVVQAHVNLANAGFSYAGLVTRYTGTGDSNMYLGALVGIDGSYLVIIYCNVGGTWSELSRSSAPAGTGTLVFEVLGNSLKLLLNGTLLTSTLDNAIQGPGLVGIRAGSAGIEDFSAAANG